ncbi:hypothetical protein [Nocardia sp. SYP-A9097]|uniref:hypothetical protein n=1 Tax=Nocardia sp. SYP-A9097 TaxID=2663237 RepID=UPI00129AF578|nr:hypothetical protein [Nocardia sp. SYP-A9097]
MDPQFVLFRFARFRPRWFAAKGTEYGRRREDPVLRARMRQEMADFEAAERAHRDGRPAQARGDPVAAAAYARAAQEREMRCCTPRIALRG